jgi:hypothetical protein
MDTLAVRLTIPPAGVVGDFPFCFPLEHSLVSAPCRAHIKKAVRMNGFFVAESLIFWECFAL